MAREDFLIQRVSLVRENEIVNEFDLSFLKEAVFIETMDLSGPKLILTFDDPDSIIRDDMGIRERDVLEARIADWGSGEMDQLARFVIWTMPNKGGTVTLNCVEQHVDYLKIPAEKAVLFPQSSVDAVIRRLIPGARYEVGAFPALESYHLLPGERPSRLLRQMAQEKASACFYRRVALVFRKLEDLYRLSPEITYEHQNLSAGHQIISFLRPNTNSVIGGLHLRNFFGWDMVKGIVHSNSGGSGRPPEFISVCNLSTMDNILKVAYPALDLIVTGNGALAPGKTMALRWHTDKADAPIDESLPAKVLIGTVSHWYSAQKYICRVKGVRVQ